MINHDNLDEYRDAELYDAVNGGHEIGGKFYFDLAREYGSPILEIACGTGRLTIPLAKEGYEITGVDLTQEMLTVAKKKAEQIGVAVDWVHTDARYLELGRKFRMVFTSGNSFQAFLDRESQEQLLETVHKHLDKQGVFAFETRNPVLSFLCAGSDTQEDAGSFIDKNGNQVSVAERRWYEHETQLEHYVTCRRWQGKLGVEQTMETKISIRYVFPQELEALLYYNGFDIVNLYGDFDLSPFQSDSPSMVCVCRKR